ncbi:MAG TPA: Gldg family protein, partial [Bacteroidia bacterium]|nr:Gldg family protein [Bacteroidia bacterium]
MKEKKKSDLIHLFLGLVILVLLNVAGQFLFTRFDLTSEKRYTLAETTEEMLEDLDDLVFFQVYLEGDFPQGAGDYKRLRDETRIMLDEFRAYGGDKIQYVFIDPAEDPDKRKRDALKKQLIGRGLIPQDIVFQDEDGSESRKELFPWAVANYHGREINIPLFGSNQQPNKVVLNHAVEGLEYELSNAIQKLKMAVKPRIAITQGHGEPDTLQLADLVKGLREYYEVDFVPFNNNLGAFRESLLDTNQQPVNKYEAVIIAGPDSFFTPQELFILDQFVLHGGNALFLVDPVFVSFDSLARTGQTASMNLDLGLQDLLFRYGARLNADLVEDLYCANVMIPVPGPQMQFLPLPWYYSPTI